MITPSWLSGSLRLLLYSSSLYSCHLFLISSCFYYIHTFSLFLLIVLFKKRFYLSFLFFGTLHSDGYIFPFLLCLLLLFFSQVFVRPPQTTILPFCISFSWGWS